MSFEVHILRRAQKELADLSKIDYERVRDAVAALSENPRVVKNWSGVMAGAFGRAITG